MNASKMSKLLEMVEIENEQVIFTSVVNIKEGNLIVNDGYSNFDGLYLASSNDTVHSGTVPLNEEECTRFAERNHMELYSASRRRSMYGVTQCAEERPFNDWNDCDGNVGLLSMLLDDNGVIHSL